MSNNPERTIRKRIEAECLLAFDQVLAELGIASSGRGYVASNRFDPNFGLVGQQRFQFGDLRVDLPDRIVVVEVESGGGTTNLVKYWPLANTLDRPLLLLHGFGQGSANDYLSHLNLWDFLWSRMREDLWSVPTPRLFARRFQYKHGYVEQLGVAAEMFREAHEHPSKGRRGLQEARPQAHVGRSTRTIVEAACGRELVSQDPVATKQGCDSYRRCCRPR